MNIIKLVGNTLNAISYIAPKYASKKALNLFATPRKGRITDEQIPLLESAYKEELSVENLSIMTYRWLGNGKKILLAHGWESNTSRWDFLIPKLKQQNYSIIALDAPAHGGSGGNHFNALLYSQCIKRVVDKFSPDIIIGHSVGGMSTIFYQFHNQNNDIEKLILLGAPAHFVGVFKRYTDLLSYNKKIVTGLNDLVLERFNNKPDYFSAAKFSENINTKGLIIHDKLDKIIPYNDALLFKEHYKNSKLVTTSGYGHGLKSPEVVNTILEFLSI